MTATARPGYVVLRQVGKDRWQLIGDVDRRPGLPARASRVQAIQDATGGKAKTGEHYRVLPRSEWRLAAE
jgi:hypothetical protein